jgi:hypothetical protein
MRGLEREEEDLEEAVSHLSIRGLDHLYQEQAQQLKQRIDRVERAEQRIELERIKTTMVEVELHNTKQEYLREKERTLLAHKGLWDELKERRSREEEAGVEEDEPEETHWDKGTQTEDEILEQDLPLKKRRIQLEEESP